MVRAFRDAEGYKNEEQHMGQFWFFCRPVACGDFSPKLIWTDGTVEQIPRRKRSSTSVR